MDDKRKKRLAILKKQNYLNQILPDILNQLSKIEPQISNAKVVQMENMEEFLSRLRGAANLINTSITKRATKQNPQIIYEILKTVSKDINKENYFSISKLRELWIAELNTQFITDNFEKIIEIDGDDFTIYDKSLNNGLWVDLSKEYFINSGVVSYEWVYEMKIWGEEWTKELLR